MLGSYSGPPWLPDAKKPGRIPTLGQIHCGHWPCRMKNPQEQVLKDPLIWGVHSHGGTPKWMVYKGKLVVSPLKWMITRGTPIYGKPLYTEKSAVGDAYPPRILLVGFHSFISYRQNYIQLCLSRISNSCWSNLRAGQAQSLPSSHIEPGGSWLNSSKSM